MLAAVGGVELQLLPIPLQLLGPIALGVVVLLYIRLLDDEVVKDVYELPAGILIF